MPMDNMEINLRMVQSHCIKIMEDIDKLCRKFEIRYSLTGGSVIGAYLYNGFIPWDDDIDIMMLREDYEKFLKICKTELPNNYSIHNFENGKDKTILFSKVVDENTTLVEQKSGGRRVVEGIFVDITVFDKFPRNKIGRFYYSCLCKAVQCCIDRGKENDKFFETLFKNICRFMIKGYENRFYNFVKRQFMEYESNSYDYTELFAGFTIPYRPELFNEYMDILFEGKLFMIVKDYISYLETRYGKREFYKEKKPGDAPHHLVYADCNRPYKEYGRV